MATIQERKAHPRENSYTCRLLAAGQSEILKKVGEEATEVVVAGALEGKERLVYESADLVYHLLVMLASQDLTWADVEAELQRRFK
jgi:phosphoribosyl-ATP pyrophosphohydrolase